jgi:hypothetical protein
LPILRLPAVKNPIAKSNVALARAPFRLISRRRVDRSLARHYFVSLLLAAPSIGSIVGLAEWVGYGADIGS